MHHYRGMKPSDLIATTASAEDRPSSKLESIRIAVIEGDPYVLLKFTHSFISGGDLEATGIREYELMLALHEAKDLANLLDPTIKYLETMRTAYNPDAPF